MKKSEGVPIQDIEPGSIADQLGLKPKDRLLRINGVQPVDLIDYLILSSEENLDLEIKDCSGAVLDFRFEKDPAEPLGLSFTEAVFDGVRVCSNHCLFCFVHQLPAGERASLYLQDDDYRLSFLQGSYITLTNLTEEDWRRIEKLHLSPLYVSVHATDPEVRRKLLGSREAGSILTQLKRLASAGITIHTQAVLCPGINDGTILEGTITDLAKLWPMVASLAVVPVGLTRHRRKLFPLSEYQKEQADRILKTVEDFQRSFFPDLGTRFVFAADEWYIIMGRNFPEEESYEDYPQLDNGVGLIRWFLSEFHDSAPEIFFRLRDYRANLVAVTGLSTIRLWEMVKRSFTQDCPSINLDFLPVDNSFFGPLVNVTGLLSGRDIIRVVQNHQAPPEVVYMVPQITLKQGENLFLDGITVAELQEICRPKKVEIVPANAGSWLKWILEKGCVAGWLVR